MRIRDTSKDRANIKKSLAFCVMGGSRTCEAVPVRDIVSLGQAWCLTAVEQEYDALCAVKA
ncbi:MAG: hypothetical protein OSJ52_01245 [Lachnospiraceae bacterium]|nr:hypothetical protein [Lachnospiraceae bacterium]